MMRTISEHQAKVYEYAKSQGERWFTIQELSTEANLPDASAKNHSTRFEEAGVFERMRISPSHVFRLSPVARRRHPELIKRLEAALPIFAARRREWIVREAALIGGAAPSHGEPRDSADTRPPIAELRKDPVATTSPVSKNTPTDAGSLDTAARPKVRKADQLIELLSRPGGASMDELVAHFGTQPHSIRAMISITTRERGMKSVLESGRYRLDA